MQQHRVHTAADRKGRGLTPLAGLVLGILLAGSPGLAQSPGRSDPEFTRRDFGPGEFGGEAVRRPQAEDADHGPSDLGPKIKAGALSAVLPGAGQFYNGQKQKAYLMGGVEVAIWTAYFVFDTQGDNRMDTAREFAGIYAGTEGDHAENYWQSVGRYLDSDAYNDARRREARALQEDPSGLIGEDDAWQWVNEDRLDGYRTLRADGNGAYDRRDFMILFAVVNRAVSVVDAVLGAGRDEPGLQARLLGLDLQVEVDPSFLHPGARCALARRF